MKFPKILKTSFILFLIALGVIGTWKATEKMGKNREELIIDCANYPKECSKFIFSYSFLTPLKKVGKFYLPLPQDSVIPLLFLFLILEMIFLFLFKGLSVFEKGFYTIVIFIISYFVFFGSLYYFWYLPNARLMGMDSQQANELLKTTSETFEPYLLLILLGGTSLAVPSILKLLQKVKIKK